MVREILSILTISTMCVVLTPVDFHYNEDECKDSYECLLETLEEQQEYKKQLQEALPEEPVKTNPNVTDKEIESIMRKYQNQQTLGPQLETR